MVHLMALHLVGLSVDLVQAFQFLVSNRHYGAVARMEVHANGIVYDFEILQIGAFRKLILAFHIYIVHQDVLVRTYQREDAGTFYSFFRLLLIIFRFCPLSGSQGGGGCSCVRNWNYIGIPVLCKMFGGKRYEALESLYGGRRQYISYRMCKWMC